VSLFQELTSVLSLVLTIIALPVSLVALILFAVGQKRYFCASSPSFVFLRN
jgi:hypothetical protein